MTRKELDEIIEDRLRFPCNTDTAAEKTLARLLRAALAVVDAERDDHTRDPEPECPACGTLAAFDAALASESA